MLPELAVIGYPPKDLLLKPSMIEACIAAVGEIADACRGITAIVGYPDFSDDTHRGRHLYNAAAVCRDGEIVHRHVKSLLPSYDVFDEHRYFEPGPPIDLTTLTLAGRDLKLGVSVCEDLWNDEDQFLRQLYHDNPISELAKRGAQLFVNCSASPFVIRKHRFRLKLMRHVAKKYAIPLFYCNQVGGNDELIFDGRSLAFDAEGQLIAEGKAFEEDLVVVECALDDCTDAMTLTPNEPRRIAPEADGFNPSAPLHIETTGHLHANPDEPADVTHALRGMHVMPPMEEAWHALVLGLGDYCRKCGFQRIVLGLSGGIDSALTCAIAVAALGRENVRGVSMPSRYSSAGSKSDAQKLAENLGIDFHTIPIEEPFLAFERALELLFTGTEPGVAEENIQARCRGVILMGISNKFGSMLVTTGNKSELAVGYCTLYGDMAGGLAVLSDLPKTMVYDLSKWVNAPGSPMHKKFGKPVIPEDTITKPPSAELRAEQTDQDSLPPYEVLDEIIERYVEREQPVRAILAETDFDPDTVRKMCRLIDRNEYKRKQAPPGLKVTGRAFGFGRRMPIAAQVRV